MKNILLFKKNLILFSIQISLFFIIACGSKSEVSTKIKSIKTDTILVKKDSIVINKDSLNGIDHDYANYFVVAIDTSLNYSFLQTKMYQLNSKLRIPIDTMRRFFNKKKQLITLPDNDEDDIYAGDYFPRRFPSFHLSLEYLDFYQRKSRDKTIVLVAGIFENEQSADSLLNTINKIETKAHKIKANIYIGCMH